MLLVKMELNAVRALISDASRFTKFGRNVTVKSPFTENLVLRKSGEAFTEAACHVAFSYEATTFSSLSFQYNIGRWTRAMVQPRNDLLIEFIGYFMDSGNVFTVNTSYRRFK